MENEKIKIIDESGDKKYFTILPNYILNHSTADEQICYAQMKKFAGENGVCFATQQTLADRLSWGRKKVGIIIKKLLKRKWIIFVGKKVFKTSPVSVYKIVDLWELNNNFYYKKRGVKKAHLSKETKREGSKRLTSEGSKRDTEEEPIKEEKEDIVLTPSEEMNLFLKDSEFFNQIAEEFAGKSKFSLRVIIDQLEKFKAHWSERNKSGKKQSWELKKTFELRRRFATWLRNAEKWGDILEEVEVTKL